MQAKKKSTNARLVVKQTQCENVRTGNDALREAKTLQVLNSARVLMIVSSPCDACAEDITMGMRWPSAIVCKDLHAVAHLFDAISVHTSSLTKGDNRDYDIIR